MPSDVDNETYQRHGEEHRAKRGKYVQRACAQCQRRKIRCEGGSPCSQCIARKRDCITGRHQPTPPMRERRAGAERMSSVQGAGSSKGVSTSELLDRLVVIEQQMKTVLANGPNKPPAADEVYETPAHSTENAMTDRGSPGPLLNIADTDRPTFVGETSMLHALRQTETHIDDLGPESRPESPLSSGRPLTPKLRGALDANAEKKSRSWLRAILLSYGIVPDKAQFDTFLRVFFDEIHILYPFLHPQTVWQTYEYLWKRSLLVSSDDLDGNEESRLSVAIVFICLATGRCTGSSRVDNASGTHSAGWSLYSVAMYLLRQFLDLSQDPPISLHGLQALALMVVYLFRLDSSEKAERILMHAISSAYILGLHRKETYANMDVFNAEMFTRVWWCLYAIDRRICLGTGRPFVIQDVNTDNRKPLNISDEWLTEHKSTTATVSELEDEVQLEISLARHTTMPYLEASISYSRIIGDVWQAVYNVDQVVRSTPGIQCDYLDILVENSRQKMPPYLKYQASVPYDDQFSGLEWWQIKQCLFIHMRYAFLKLLIRRPVGPSTGLHPPTHDNIANEAVCAQLAASIIEVFDNIPATYPKYAFSFINYMMSSTMILFSIVLEHPGFKDSYRKPIISAVKNLSLYCRKTWVSGKTIRTVSKLTRMARATLGPLSETSEDKAQNRDERPKDKAHNRDERAEKGQQDDDATTHDPRASAVTQPTQHWDKAPSSLSLQQNHNVSTVNSRLAPTNTPIDPPLAPSIRPHIPAAGLPISSTRSVRAHPQAHRSQHLPPQPSNQSSTGDDAMEFSFLWPPISPNNEIIDLPSWALTDFEFEQAFSGAGNVRSVTFTAPELPDLDHMQFD